MKEPKTDKRTKAQASPGLTVSIIAGAFVVFMVVFTYAVPYKRYRDSERDVAGLRQRVSQLHLAKESEEARLRSQEELTERLKDRKPNFDLWSFMNTMLTETKLKERAVLENSKLRSDRRGALSGKGASEDVTAVQLKLSGVTLSELVELLHKIYAANSLVVMYKLDYLRPTNDNKGLECNITFLTPKA